MTRISISIQVRESVDVEALGKWFEAWLMDTFDKDGEIFDAAAPPDHPNPAVYGSIHLESVEAKPPASGRRTKPCRACLNGFPVEYEVAPCCGRARIAHEMGTIA